MLIDWFTVSAQVLNFLILVWLLKRFLYKPILNAIDARERRIAAELAAAATTAKEALKEREEFKQKNVAFDSERDKLLSKMRDEADVERQRLLDEARQAADALRTKRKEALNREQQSLNDEIVRRTRAEVFAVAQKTLTDLAGTTLEARICDVFMQRLRELKGDAKESFVNALKTATEPTLVRSAFDLSTEQRAAVQQTVNETFADDPTTPLKAEIHLRFETVPEVISGIEIIANGRKLAWSIADHLASLGKGVSKLLQAQAATEAKPEEKTKIKPERSKPEAERP